MILLRILVGNLVGALVDWMVAGPIGILVGNLVGYSVGWMVAKSLG